MAQDITPQHFEIVPSKNKLVAGGEEGNVSLGPHKTGGGFDSQKIDINISANDTEVLFSDNGKIAGSHYLTFTESAGRLDVYQISNFDNDYFMYIKTKDNTENPSPFGLVCFDPGLSGPRSDNVASARQQSFATSTAERRRSISTT